MKDEHNLPSAFKRLKAIKKQIQNEDTKSMLNRFVYRYRIARAFKGIDAPDIGDRTVRGYARGMKLLLAYSAFDEIRAARVAISKLRPAQVPHAKVIDTELADNLRKNNALQHLVSLPTAVKNASVKKNLVAFFLNKNDDVMCIATALRNTFAHGTFTAAGAGLTTKRSQKHIDDLADAVLDLTDDIALECVAQLENELKG